MDNASFFIFFLKANIISTVLGYIIDFFVGDPEWRFHPIRIIGSIILFLEKIFYKINNRFVGGVLLIITTLTIVVLPVVVILSAAYALSPILYIILNGIIIWIGLSVKDMSVQVGKVQSAMATGDIEKSRAAISQLVSRDTAKMDNEKISSSLIETISENFTDAVVSPIFYAVLLGGVGVAIFKVTSTLDSMVGYDNEKYKTFGTASAKFDDLLNFIPARVSVIPIALASLFYGLNAKKSITVFLKHRLDHKSPNSAHSISAFAGALDVKLGGATSYGGQIINKPIINIDGKTCGEKEIESALILYKEGAFIFLLICLILILIPLGLCIR